MPRYLGDDWLLPLLDERVRPFFTAGALTFRRCTACGALQHPPEDVCSRCQGTGFEPWQSRGEGRVESVVVVHHAVHPLLKARVPYAVAVVSVDDAPGIRVVGNVVGRAPAEVRIGDPVRVVFEELDDPESGERLRIPQWAAGGPDAGRGGSGGE